MMFGSCHLSQPGVQGAEQVCWFLSSGMLGSTLTRLEQKLLQVSVTGEPKLACVYVITEASVVHF